MPAPPSTAGTVSDRRQSDPEDRSQDRACGRDDPRARRRRRLGPRLGRGGAVGRPAIGRGRSTRSIPRPAEILHTIESNRFVTGVTWVDGEMWHGTWEGDESELRQVDPQTGEVLQQLTMPAASACPVSSPTAGTGSSAAADEAARAARRAEAEAVASNAVTPGARYDSPPAVRSPGSSPPAHRPLATAGRRGRASGTAARGRDR